ncbi:dipicolinate synthase subunit A [Halolactibacillus miurensis]|uniref:Dipicolinate synthase subunit A n=1 Tax=Halolactibacillus miurensis TaxID=306541 RepID=A0A1I6QGE0_9BACI|nr:dipicolinate synthase subunit DpsA [Halolactibacillus miurensis]GEM03386.1 dipicolinate synthase subunit A [Halolactibacillus miurensis]SFS51472.1 dipicolinate synthase subunit A [Halolactibacillus miurensis]
MIKRKIALLGGDQRYLACMEKLAEVADLYLVGFDAIYPNENVPLHLIPFEELDAVILPITGISNDDEIMASFSQDRLYLPKDSFKRMKQGAFVFTGIASKRLRELADDSEVTVIEIFARDDVAIYNAVPTAEGTIMLAIKHMKKTLYQSRVVLLGFGRVGDIVADRFFKLGADVFVGVRKQKDIAKANSLGYHGFHLKDLDAYIKSTDLFINTIPAMMLTSTVLDQLTREQLIIDLASLPGGVDFDYAKKRELRVIHALGIPAKVAPKTAGTIIATAIIEELSQNE